MNNIMRKLNWKTYLESDVIRRLGECCNTKSDLPKLVNARWLFYKETGKAEQGFTKEDALIYVLELLDSNSQDFDLTEDEYNELCK